MNNRRPRTEPLGTPEVTDSHEENCLLIATLWWQEKAFDQFKM